MKDKAYKLGLTVPQYVDLMRKHYKRKHTYELLGILFFSITAAVCVVAIGYAILLALI